MPVKVKYVDVEKQKQQNKRRKDKKNAKWRLRCVDYNYADHIVGSLVVDDDFLVFHILSRLPVKSLMRFKCVCKRWKSVIELDAHFISLHHTHSEARPGFFIVVPTSTAEYSQDHTRDYESFLSGNLHSDGRGAKIHTVRKIQAITYHKILGPVRGFICLADIFAVQICNVGTGEVTPWIKSSVFTNVEKENVILEVYEQPECYFGFDPKTGEHKVIFLWYEGKFEKRKVCEVLTVGDNRWRIIDNAPPCRPNGNISAYANGSIYWYMYSGIAPWRGGNDYGEAVEYSESIMAFDIGSEKFRVILIPKFTILEYTVFPCYGLLEMHGCLTVVRRKDRTVKMWKFHDYNKENGTSTASSEKDWTEVNVRLPSYISFDMPVYFHSIAGKDQLILETYNPPPSTDEHIHDGFQRNVKFARFYSYNLINKAFREFKIKGISCIPENCRTECATLVENLLPVQKKRQH
ncbi:hypothetical protein MKW92_036601 [Papaver armeniacum]|nr:hypothetical protein MKW92_036601 [Papaver armeniacum]